MFVIEGDNGINSKLKELSRLYNKLRLLKNGMGDVTASIKKLIEVDKLNEICDILEDSGVVDEEVAAVADKYSDETSPIRKEVDEYYKDVMDVVSNITKMKAELLVESKVIKNAVDKLEFFVKNSNLDGLLRSPIKNRKITITVTAIKEGELLSSTNKSCIVFNTSSWCDDTVKLRLKKGRTIPGVFVVTTTKDGLMFSETLPENCYIKEVISNV